MREKTRDGMQEYSLDSSSIGTVDKLAVDEDASLERGLAAVGFGVELVREGCGHCGGQREEWEEDAGIREGFM